MEIKSYQPNFTARPTRQAFETIVMGMGNMVSKKSKLLPEAQKTLSDIYQTGPELVVTGGLYTSRKDGFLGLPVSLIENNTCWFKLDDDKSFLKALKNIREKALSYVEQKGQRVLKEAESKSITTRQQVIDTVESIIGKPVSGDVFIPETKNMKIM